jgi:hypothetical protein
MLEKDILLTWGITWTLEQFLEVAEQRNLVA